MLSLDANKSDVVATAVYGNMNSKQNKTPLSSYSLYIYPPKKPVITHLIDIGIMDNGAPKKLVPIAIAKAK